MGHDSRATGGVDNFRLFRFPPDGLASPAAHLQCRTCLRYFPSKLGGGPEGAPLFNLRPSACDSAEFIGTLNGSVVYLETRQGM